VSSGSENHVSETPRYRHRMATAADTALRCPYAGVAVTEGDRVAVCPECRTVMLEESWIENRGCTTYGCRNAPDYRKDSPLVGGASSTVISRNAPERHSESAVVSQGAKERRDPRCECRNAIATDCDKRCPFAGCGFRAGDRLAVCNKCGAAHLEASWIENDGCTAYGCVHSPDFRKDRDRIQISASDVLGGATDSYSRTPPPGSVPPPTGAARSSQNTERSGVIHWFRNLLNKLPN
jgi:hypothetical protein